MVAGDVFDKKETTPESISFYTKLCRWISEYYPLVVIPGNHDCQNNGN